MHGISRKARSPNRERKRTLERCYACVTCHLCGWLWKRSLIWIFPMKFINTKICSRSRTVRQRNTYSRENILAFCHVSRASPFALFHKAAKSVTRPMKVMTNCSKEKLLRCNSIMHDFTAIVHVAWDKKRGSIHEDITVLFPSNILSLAI